MFNMPSANKYLSLKTLIRNATMKKATLRAKQLTDVAQGRYYKNGILNNMKGSCYLSYKKTLK